MRFSLRENETNGYFALFQDYLEQVQDLNNKVMDVLNETMQQSEYDKLQNLISYMIDVYEDVILQNVKTGAFSSWEGSDASLRACMRMYQAGEEADQVCAQMEQHLQECMTEILKIEKAEVAITERPKVSEAGMEGLEEICKTAEKEITDIRADCLAQIISRKEENEIYGTLAPLVEGIAASLEMFYESALGEFKKLHEFVREISHKMRNQAEEASGRMAAEADSGALEATAAANTGRGEAAPGAVTGTKTAAALAEKLKARADFGEFREITRELYHNLCQEESQSKKTVGYEKMIQIADVYHQFYEQHGTMLEDSFQDSVEREEYIKREYIEAIQDRGNDKYFNGEDVWTFRSYAQRGYACFWTVADMVKNVTKGCIDQTADDANLIYGAYVLFDPILNGHIKEEGKEECMDFCGWAVSEIRRILGEDEKAKAEENATDREQAGDIHKMKRHDSEEGLKVLVLVVEKMVHQVGVDQTNQLMEQYGDDLDSTRKIYSRKPKPVVKERDNRRESSRIGGGGGSRAPENPYGRYIVTRQSIQAMATMCGWTNSILEPLDEFYREKFEKLGKGFGTASNFIHKVSSTFSLWDTIWKKIKSRDEEDASKENAEDASEENAEDASEDKSTDTEKMVKEALNLLAILSTGQAAAATGSALKLLDSAMPLIKKNHILEKVSSGFWKFTRETINTDYNQRLMDQYMLEHYQIKHGIALKNGGLFVHYHNVGKSVEESQRRIYENVIFAADMYISQNYTIRVTQPVRFREIACGIYLNLVRSGFCSSRKVEASTANRITDKLYQEYRTKEQVSPRVDISPDHRNI